MKFQLVIQSLAVLVGLSAAAPPTIPGSGLAQNEVTKRATNCNTATNRACWTTSPDFNISTDYELSTPNTGVVRQASPTGKFISCRKANKVIVYSRSD